MKFPSMLRILKNAQRGTRSTAGSASTPYTPYTPYTPHSPPVANAGSDQIVSVGTTVNFDGSGSTGSNLSYSWDFGADANPTTGSGAKASCKYTTYGVKTVTLTVSYTGPDGKKVEANDTVDITVIKLTLKGTQTVTRGDTAKYTAVVEPAGLNPTYNWRFTGGGGEIERSNGPSTWSGMMAVSGTVEVTVVVNGKNFTKSVTTTVQSRGWIDNFPRPPISHREPGTLPENPTKKSHLGHTVSPGQSNFTVPEIILQVTIVGGAGPNTGWLFIANAPVASDAWDMEAHTSSALTDESHSFYRLNQRRYGARYMGLLAERVRIHEGVQLDRNYTSHAAQGLAEITKTPLNPWAEPQVKHFTVINNRDPRAAAQAFGTQVQVELVKRRTAVIDKFKPHPANKYPTLPDPFAD